MEKENMIQDGIASFAWNDLIFCNWVSVSIKNGAIQHIWIHQDKGSGLVRLLMTLREKYAIFSYEDAVKLNNFYKIIGAVKAVTGYNETHLYCIKTLALKLGHSLKKSGDIIQPLQQKMLLATCYSEPSSSANHFHIDLGLWKRCPHNPGLWGARLTHTHTHTHLGFTVFINLSSVLNKLSPVLTRHCVLSFLCCIRLSS